MLALTFVVLALFQDDDAVKQAHKELDKTIAKFAATEDKFSLGAAHECINQVQMAAEAFEKGARPAETFAIYDGAFERISKAITAAESRTSELRKIQGHLEKGRRRAATLDSDEKKAAALRYALDRAQMVWSNEVNFTMDLVNMGLRNMQGGHLEEALDALHDAEEKLAPLRGSSPGATPQAPRMPPILRARIYCCQGKLKEAVDELRRGIDLLPEFLAQELDFKNLHAKPEDYDKHIKALEKKAADDPDALLLLGFERYFSEGREKSKTDFEKVLKKSPEDRTAKVFLEKLNE